jgi:hypothetical protein
MPTTRPGHMVATWITTRERDWDGELEGLEQMKSQIAGNHYAVDAGAVADEILKKLELIRRGRSVLAERPAHRSRRNGIETRPAA